MYLLTGGAKTVFQEGVRVLRCSCPNRFGGEDGFLKEDFACLKSKKRDISSKIRTRMAGVALPLQAWA